MAIFGGPKPSTDGSQSHQYMPATQDEHEHEHELEPVEFGSAPDRAQPLPSPIRDGGYGALPQFRNGGTEDARAVSPVSSDGDAREVDTQDGRFPHKSVVASKEAPLMDGLDNGDGGARGSAWPPGAERRMWTPIWLTKTVLLAFAFVFACMMLATGLLYHFSLINHGLSVQEETHHYGWKYGPTALLVIVGACWSQVDHHNKILTPWKELQQGPVPAEKSLLLDYVSPILPTNFIRSIRNRHWSVVFSILGHVLIQLTTVFSTGLMVLQATTEATPSAKFNVQNEFHYTPPKDPLSYQEDAGPGAAQLYYGINFQNMDYPTGTSEDNIIPFYEIPEIAGGSLSYVLTVEGLQVDLDCEILPIKNATQVQMPWKSILASFFVADVNTTDCNIGGITVGEGPDHDYYHNKTATQNYQGLFRAYPCNVDFNFAKQYLNGSDIKAAEMIYNPDADQRIVMSVADLRFSAYNESFSGPSYIYVHELKVALCKPSYIISDFNVGASLSGGATQVALANGKESKNKTLDGLPPGVLALAVTSSSASFNLGPGGNDYVLSETVPTFFQLMSLKHGNSSVGAFLDPKLLVDVGSQVFKGIATQYLGQRVLKSTNLNASGEITYTENRLQVKEISTAFMCTFLGLLTLLALAMILVRPHNVVPQQPGSIATATAILAASHRLYSKLSDAGGRQTVKLLRGSYFQSAVSLGSRPAFTVEPCAKGRQDTSDISQGIEQLQEAPWWRPPSATSWFLSLAVALPLVLIAILEVLQHVSDQHQGILQIEPRQSTSVVFATYIPSALMLGVASIYSALEFNAAVFTPYDALKSGKAVAERSINLNLVGTMAPHALFLSLKTRHLAILAALAANLIGSFLTIVVSGLYSIEMAQTSKNVTIRATDEFKFDGVDLSLSDNQASAVDSLIEYLGLNSPKGTYGDLAFGNFEAVSVPGKNDSGKGEPIHVYVPATRAKLNCTSVPSDSRVIHEIEVVADGIQVGAGENGEVSAIPGYLQVAFNTSLEFSKYCDKSPSKKMSEASWLQYFWIPNSTEPAYIGKASTMEWDDGIFFGDGALSSNLGGVTAGTDGCPSFAVTLGTARLVSEMKHGKKTDWNFEHDLGTIVCYQNVEQVTAWVELTLPDTVYRGVTNMKIDESDPKLLKTKSGSEKFPLSVNAWLEGLTDSASNQTAKGPNGTSSANTNLDNFIHAMIFSKSGRPIDELAGAKNVKNLESTANALYGTYMAQAISLNMRKNATKPEALPKYNGYVTGLNEHRLVQNKTTKITLQSMLAAMVACGLATAFYLRVRDVLPHNPCSIAGTASLLAGSEMATQKSVPPGSEWLGDRELEKRGVFSGGLYSLKHWEARNGGDMPRYGVDAEDADV